MARYEVSFAYTGSSLISGTASTYSPEFKKYIVAVRDLFREEFQGSSVVISDICTWTGYNTSSRGFGFILKDDIDEWFIYLPYISSNHLGYIFGTYNTTTLKKYFIARNGVDPPATGTSDNLPLAIYNCRKGSFAMGFNDPVALTYTNGDFSLPQYSPYSAPAQFFPLDMLRSYVDTVRHSSSYVDYSVIQIVYDDVHKALFYHTSNSGIPRPNTVYMSGQILTELNVGDTDQSCVAWLDLNESGTHTRAFAMAYNASGKGERFDIDFVNSFTLDNYLLPNGKVDFNSVMVINNLYTKGIFHTDLVRVQGPGNTVIGYGNLYEGPSGPLIRYSAYLATMYKENLPSYPYDIGYDSRSYYED